MSVVRVMALEQLATVLTTAIPELAGHVCIGTPMDNHEQVLPSMAITWAGALAYDSAIEEDLAVLPVDGDHPVKRGVFNVGAHEGMVQIRVLAGTPRKRDALCEAVVGVFLAQTNEWGYPRPGVIATQVTDADIIPWLASFELEDDQWVNVLAFERQHEGLVQATGIVPALVVRTVTDPSTSPATGIYTIEDLRLGLTHDLATSYDADTMQPPAVEVVRINQDGTITTL